jgi:hypothetical protein
MTSSEKSQKYQKRRTKEIFYRIKIKQNAGPMVGNDRENLIL